MNKQELIKHIEDLPYTEGPIADTITINRNWILESIKQLDEPEKVKVPQCVHKYIQEAKEYNWDLQDLMKSIDDEDSEKLQRWFYHECNQETLARAWIDGYEVEEEKRYLVRVNGISGHSCYLNKGLLSEEYFFASQSEVNVYRTKHTRKELEEAGLGEVFNSSLFEVVEVE